jgi:protein SCO1/2
MTDPVNPGQRILWGVLILILVGTAGAWLGTRYLWPDLVPRKAGATELPDYGSVADFSLTNQQGKPIRRTDLDGQPWVADFIFTRCAGPCPLLTAQMAAVADSLGASSPVRFVSFSVDPERDTPETLTRYAEGYGADPARWHFLTGPRRAIAGLATDSFHLGMGDPTPVADRRAFDGAEGDAEKAGEMTADEAIAAEAAAEPEGDDPFYDIPHSLRFTLVDGKGTIRGYYDGTDPEAIAKLYADLGTLTGGASGR